jgi:hypothetical protein
MRFMVKNLGGFWDVFWPEPPIYFGLNPQIEDPTADLQRTKTLHSQ